MSYNTLAMEKRIKTVFPKIEKSIYIKKEDLDVTAWLTKEPVSFADRESGKKVKLTCGDNWGDLFDCAWMNLKGYIPVNEYENYVLIVDISGEGCVVNSVGEPLQGITTVASMYDFSLGMPGKKIIYTEKLEDAEGKIDIWLDAGNNDLFGNHKNNGTLVDACTAIVNSEMLGLYYDFEVLNELRSRTPENKARYHTLLNALYNSALLLNEFTEEEAIEARKLLLPELLRRNIDAPFKISAIGHAHIDLAWLWPIRETIRKGARTFSTALLNIEKYSDYVFGASQPQLYQWIKESYPSLYKQMKKAVKEKKWELQGAMWVEADTNITGGEALIRQILYGKKYFLEEFGEDIKTLWLPDVFGYTAALPQILKKSGVDYFMTIKLSWSEFNKFPHHTFNWSGIDGSKVLVHMPPEGNYNSSAAPRAILDAEEKFVDKCVSDECLLLFGIGDGGGGPGEEHIERLLREKNLQGLAPVKQEYTADFFDRIAESTDKYKTWYGELYLEYHRGTYTSEGRNKRYNKLMENLLRDYEIISCMTGKEYDHQAIEDIWKEVLLYQFHDILPGSSIKRVYDESCERYAELEQKLYDYLNISKGSGGGLVCNTLSWERSGWIKDNGRWKFYNTNPLSMSFPVDEEEDDNSSYAINIDSEKQILENEYLKVSFNDRGEIVSLIKKYYDFEVIKVGETGNVISVYKDDGDAWDFPHDYKLMKLEEPAIKSLSFTQDGPDAKLVTEYTFRNSTIKQETVLTEESKRLEFRTIIDWHDKNVMVRSAFPLSIESENLTCGIQFGYIERPSHDNTRRDMAKFEVCAHNYVDKSRRDCGVAVLSDCKYGFSSDIDTIEINLLRSTEFPNAEGDIGLHKFTYAIYPHGEDHVNGEVVKEAMELSQPLRIIPQPDNGFIENESFVLIDCDNVFVETIKQAEDGKGIIVRFYEAYGEKTKTEICFKGNYNSISEVNLIEQHPSMLKVSNSCIDTEFTPFEIKTFKLEF